MRLSTSAPRSISTHALTEGDDFKTTSNRLSHIFQLTPSRRATKYCGRIRNRSGISTHALTEGDEAVIHTEETDSDISTHALTEGDFQGITTENTSGDFNSRPHGGRRKGNEHKPWKSNISTHALTEGDSRQVLLRMRTGHFNSRPHGGRHRLDSGRSRSHISTHALTEGDENPTEVLIEFIIFQLTPSRRATSFRT